MNRRTLFGNTLKTTIALSAFGFVARAQAPPGADQPTCPPPLGKPQINSEISANHRHEFAISYEDVITGKEQTISIQGKSGHPHQVVITADILLALRTVMVVDVESSTDAGHKHVVRIKRDTI
jgi:hypothetical protein